MGGRPFGGSGCLLFCHYTSSGAHVAGSELTSCRRQQTGNTASTSASRQEAPTLHCVDEPNINTIQGELLVVCDQKGLSRSSSPSSPREHLAVAVALAGGTGAPPAQQTRHVHPILGWSWPSVYNAGPASAQYWANGLCLLQGCRLSLDLSRIRSSSLGTPLADLSFSLDPAGRSGRPNEITFSWSYCAVSHW